MFGLICNEFITIFTPGRGIFDWNDILLNLIGGGLFFDKLIEKLIELEEKN